MPDMVSYIAVSSRFTSALEMGDCQWKSSEPQAQISLFTEIDRIYAAEAANAHYKCPESGEVCIKFTN